MRRFIPLMPLTLAALATLALAMPADAGRSRSGISIGYTYRDGGNAFSIGYSTGYRHHSRSYIRYHGHYDHHRYRRYHDYHHRTVYRTTYVAPPPIYREVIVSSPTYVVYPEPRDYTYDRTRVVAQRERVAVIDDRLRQRETPSYFISAEGAWDDLGSGQVAKALRLFGALVKHSPNDPELRLGLAIAQAEQGQLNAAVTSMRLALQSDIAVGETAPLGDGHKLVIDDLIDDYMTLLDNPARRADASFMLAALFHLTDDVELARRYAQRAAEAGDRSAANAALRYVGLEDAEQE